MCTNVSSCILTIDGPDRHILREKAKPVKNVEESQEIVKNLLKEAEKLNVFAGLAAPQIGSSTRIFLYSYDRKKEHVEIVINPEITSYEGEPVNRWEACFSVIFGKEFRAAEVKRYNSIKVSYLNVKGERVSKTLEGFGAQVFQHEYDHLEGIVNIEKQGAKVKTFVNKQEFDEFMIKVREGDKERYIPPHS